MSKWHGDTACTPPPKTCWAGFYYKAMSRVSIWRFSVVIAPKVVEKYWKNKITKCNAGNIVCDSHGHNNNNNNNIIGIIMYSNFQHCLHAIEDCYTVGRYFSSLSYRMKLQFRFKQLNKGRPVQVGDYTHTQYILLYSAIRVCNK